VATANEKAYNPSCIHPVKHSASPGEFVRSARRNWVRLVVLSKVRGSLCRVTSSPPSTNGSLRQ